MSGSDAKRAVQARWLSSTTPSAPARPSSSLKSRPRCGVARSSGNMDGETVAPRRVTAPSGRAHSTSETHRRRVARTTPPLPEARASRGSRGRAGVPERLPDVHDGLGIRIRQRPQQHAVDDAEHRRVGADAQGEDTHHRGGEAGLAAQPAGGVAHVPPEVVQPAPAPDVARAFPNQRRIAQLPPRGPARLRLGDACVTQALTLQLEMEPQFLLQVLLRLTAPEIRPETTAPVRRVHRVSPPPPRRSPAA